MSIKIDRDLCIGCGRCVDICPGNLIQMVGEGENRKAEMMYPDECWGCISCIKVCPVQAIKFYLGADIGGNGGALIAKPERTVIHWSIYDQEKVTQEIDIDRRNANKY
ncbi:4Fe-4S dicluster domain-containing protein [Loigolactobacillus coryniformis]|uniref:Ferredoxin n=1 Tax=Loigolactobacillus coryniformis subsp. coryniformis CECT 5711 TaxID=1185325 RepID=J3JC00_9LACO|nr:ferredoxin family protein [Loigolactobacillus coryniformis]EJN56184.1 Ferredoxin [Loigolactobacillus coryniformis subsp. coryniformis CECT 5711]MBW4801894.1 ferredoxin family protein [Loigolactobacillus coryniformis subsp. torquens]MBW4804608.1 ferredoxin family protein [Loigolactobacillus coryniformis subsp. torquens]